MADTGPDRPVIWSRSISRLPEEDRIEQLESLLSQGELSFWDDAAALREYIDLTGASQSVCAKKLGRSQAGVANRLRILKLPPEVMRRMRRHSLSERHARAVLRLGNEQTQLKALDVILSSEMNVAQTEAYMDELLALSDPPSPDSAFSALLTELKKLTVLFPDIEYKLSEEEDSFSFHIRIPRKYDAL